MNADHPHPHGHPSGHHKDAAEPKSARHPRRRPRAGIWPALGKIPRFFFRKRSGRISLVKISSLAFLCLASIYVALISGLVPIDIAGPMVKRALQEKIGRGNHVEIGETRLGQNEAGRPVLSVRGIVIKSRDGSTIVTAPRAEIVLDDGMLYGNFRAKRIDLIDAVMTLRIDENGRIGITAGGKPKKHRMTKAADAQEGIPEKSAPDAAKQAPDVPPQLPFVYPELAAWLGRLETSGLDGIALAEVGLKQGTLVVENAKSNRRWIFANTNFSVSRPAEGGVTFSLSSSSAGEAWSLNATISAVQNGSRAIDVVARDISPEDVMLAAGLTSNQFYIEPRISGILRAQIGEDGKLLAGGLRATAGRGAIGNSTDENSRIMMDSIQLQADFNPEQRSVVFSPVVFQAGASKIALQAVAEAPKTRDQIWHFSVLHGMAALGSGRPGDAALVLDQIVLRGTWDPRALRLALEHGDISGATASLALSGSVSFGGPKPTLSLGIASNMLPVSAAKRLWPAPIAAGARTWLVNHVDHGLIQRFLLAVNMPLDKVGVPNVELPEEAVQIDAKIIGGVFRPLGNLPPVREADVTATITGRTVRVKMAKAIIQTKNDRRFTLSDGELEILNHAPPNPQGTIKFHFGGPADAIAETVNLEPLHSALGITFDPSSTKGTVSANANFALTFRSAPTDKDIDYTFDATLSNFSSDNLVHGQRVEGLNAKLIVTPPQITIKGEGKIAGAPSKFDYRKTRSTGDADFNLTATLDNAARARAGLDLAPWLTGPVTVKSQGKLNAKGESRIDVETDLTHAQITDLVPGWSKAAGRAAKATYKFIQRDNSIKIEDLSVSGSGTVLRGAVELEPDGDVVSANFPTFQLSDGDKASLRADRAPDGTLKATVRGDVLDVRGLLKRLTEGSVQTGPVQGKQYKPRDLDLEVKVGAASGNNGEVIRQLDLRILRRNSEIRNFSLRGKIGRDGSLVGELRARDGGRPVLYISSSDAGALFRYGDYYGKIQGGESWVLIDPPHPDGSAQEGTVQVRDFSIRGEQGLNRLVGGAQRSNTNAGIPFRRLKINFSRTPGKFNIKEALIYGDSMGATCNGVLDYSNDRVHLRGNYIPAYGLNHAAGKALFFFGTPSNEGLFAYTFDIAGPASGPTLRVNPISGMVPGMFRKLFEFRGAQDTPPPAQLDR